MAIALISVFAVLTTARADDDHDHEMARQAVERGEIKSLADILHAVRGRLPGEVAGVKLERKHGRLVYEFRVVGARGRLLEVYVDAATGRIDRTREK